MHRRVFCRFTSVLLLCGAFRPRAHAAPPEETPNVSETAYETGTRLLKSGRNYNDAIAALEQATQAEPKNAAYFAALGCAYAARFASVCAALRHVPETSNEYGRYLHAKKRWDTAQTDPQNRADNTPPPSAPPLLTTPDDAAPLTLIHTSGVSLYGAECNETKPAPVVLSDLKALLAKSLAAFDTAHRLAQTLPKEARAALEYERGSGLFLLWFCGQGSRTAVSFAPEKIAEALAICTEKMPDSPDYWHAQALGLVPKYAAWRDNDTRYPAPTENSALAAFDRALALKPNAARLLQSALVMNAMLPHPDYVARLEKAARKIRNAQTWHLLALAHFAHARQNENGSDAKAAWRRGFAVLNTASHNADFTPPVFTLPAPLLQAAWALRPLQRFPEIDSIFLGIETFLVNFVEEEIARTKPGYERDALLAVEALRATGANAVQSVFTLLETRKTTWAAMNDETIERLLYGFNLYDDAVTCLTKLQTARPSDYKTRLLRDMTEARNKARQNENAWRASDTQDENKAGN